jgi:tryptophanyl-tRNA synthetase
MSASQPETAIFTSDDPELATKKVMGAYTGGRETVKLQRELGGSPEVCNIYAYYFYLFEEDDTELAATEAECRSGALTCGECKARLAKKVKMFLVDFQVKREKAKDHLDEYLLTPVKR